MATMADVARLAGVSLSTVSYALSGERPISDATRQKVLAAMDELEFSPNALARGLASRRSGIIALLLPTDESDADPFMAEIIVAAAEAARSSGYHLLLWTEPIGSGGELRELVRHGLIDGALVLAVRLDDQRIPALTRAGIPFTLIGRTADDVHSYADADEEQAAAVTMDHLVSLGHRHVAFVGPPIDQIDQGYGIVVRLIDGLTAAAETNGVALSIHSCERTADAGRSVARHVLDADPRTSAAIVMNDPALGGFIGAARDRGLDVPTDLSVIGLFSTSLAASLTSPPLTTVSPVPAHIGRLAAENLVAELRRPDEGPRRDLVSVRLSIRDSTTRARSA
ncbi:MAG: LacI family DNA-binding transcriptional regulator [Actinomycetota bacterium]